MRISLFSARAVRTFATLALVGWASVAGAQNPPPPTPQVPSTIISLRAVGGVAINSDGVINNVEKDQLGRLSAEYSRALHAPPGDLNAPSDLRKISLRKLDAALAEAAKHGKPLDESLLYLAGLQQVKYVFVYPEEHDIVLAGFGEGWRVDPQGTIVGATTGKPVLLLDDLLVALRSADEASRTGISCSIDPTPAGLEKLQTFLNQQGGRIGDNPKATIAGIERNLGPQQVTVGGVPATSHFALVLVAADYRMKRLAMGFDESPIAGLPSFLQMLKGSSKIAKTMLPRWWLAPRYDSLLASPDGLAWQLRGASVEAMTEEEALSAGGERHKAAHTNSLAKKWADNMTARYDALSAKEAVFGQLRNCIDLAVVAALIAKEQLPEKCGWSMPLLLSDDLDVESLPAARQVDSRASVLRRGNGWVISASGGVQMHPWQLLEKSTPSPELSNARARFAPRDKHWWWN